MSLERAEERVRLAEHQVAILAKSRGEHIFELILGGFAAWCTVFLGIKILLVFLGVAHTIASPLTVILSVLFLVMGGSFILIRVIARKIAAHELHQSKLYLSQFRYMAPMTPTAHSSGGGGGFSNYKKTGVMTGKQFAAQVKAEGVEAAAKSKKNAAARSGKR